MPENKPDFRRWSSTIEQLAASVRALEPLAAELGLPPIRETEWYGALFQKLLPQVTQPPFLIVAVCGGTNTGKSVVFNHLAGSSVSRAHPNATQTRHPVCLVPKNFAAREEINRLFDSFEVRDWKGEDDPLQVCDEHLLFVRDDASGRLSPRLLLLDTPDIDGVLKENWQRADLVRHAADVLVCVLTQQKYNDAAVREFFAAAAEAQKTVLVVFNMLAWPRQQELVPGWLEIFSRGTGVQPLHVYGVPLDHDAAEENRLPFYPLSTGATDPREDLSLLQFDAIKIRTLGGSLRQVLDPVVGLPAFLQAIDARASQYTGALNLLDHDIREQEVKLPDLPRTLVWDEIWKWLDSRRTKFDRLVHGAYSKLTDLATRWWRADPEAELTEFRAAEYDRLQAALAVKLDRLERLRRGGNEILSRELDGVLGGLQRGELFAELARRHAAAPLVTDGYRQFIRDQLDAFERQNPALVRGISWALVGTAVVRPAISVGLAFVGAHGVELAAGNWAISWAGDVAIGAAAAAGGEAVAVPASQLALRTLLNRLFAQFYLERVKLLTKTLDDVVLGPVVTRLARLAQASEVESRRAAQSIVGELADVGILNTES